MVDWWWDIVYLTRYLPDFTDGVRVTLELSFYGFATSVVIGLLGALARQSRIGPIRLVAGAYVEFIRNTPTLAQIFLVYFGLPTIGIGVSNFEAGVIALAFSGGGYLTEIFRAGFEAIPKGQREAAVSLGMSKGSTYFFVLLPQAVRIVWPPVISQLTQTILGSSMVSVIGVAELTNQAQLVNAETYRTIPTFIIALVMYLVLSNLAALLGNLLGKAVFRAPTNIRPVSRPDSRWARVLRKGALR